jgi:3-carboxy-cis,cis-muconate cycloisomerase
MKGFPVRLIDSLATTEPLAEVFSDSSVFQAMLAFEVSLAQAQAKLDIIPKAAAHAIASAARVISCDMISFAKESLRAGTPAIPLVKALRTQVREINPTAADFVHWGATSQDVTDTALILLLQKVIGIFQVDLNHLERALRILVDRHQDTVMLGRTLLQPGPPITFGLKAAGWLGSLRRSRIRLESAFSEAFVLQLGGATGTLAAMGDRGIEVGELVARHLKLAYPDAPWHTHRDRLAAVVCACGILTGGLGKMARDITLLMQTEVDEAAEQGGSGRGGSSTMPQKRNPIASTIALAAAHRIPAMVAAFLSQMLQEHERAVGGSQAEWPTMAAVTQSTGVAIASMAEAAQGLRVNQARMKKNLQATRGAIFAEKAALLLSSKLGREAAHEILAGMTDGKLSETRTLSVVLAEAPEVQHSLEKATLRKLEDAYDYLGMAREFTKRLSRPTQTHARSRK